MLSVASMAVATAALLMTAALPHAAAPRFVETGPSILEQAFANQKPPTTLDLLLPSDLAVEVSPLRVDGIYGPARPAPTVRSFRLRGSNAIVIVAMLPGTLPIVPPTNTQGEALSVHGAYAANYSVEATSLSAVAPAARPGAARRAGSLGVRRAGAECEARRGQIVAAARHQTNHRDIEAF